jgi:hypothetical protein
MSATASASSIGQFGELRTWDGDGYLTWHLDRHCLVSAMQYERHRDDAAKSTVLRHARVR